MFYICFFPLQFSQFLRRFVDNYLMQTWAETSFPGITGKKQTPDSLWSEVFSSTLLISLSAKGLDPDTQPTTNLPCIWAVLYQGAQTVQLANNSTANQTMVWKFREIQTLLAHNDTWLPVPPALVSVFPCDAAKDSCLGVSVFETVKGKIIVIKTEVKSSIIQHLYWDQLKFITWPPNAI